jgi:hypothetical protein
MMKLDQEAIRRLRALRLFENCGTPVGRDFAFPHALVFDWKRASELQDSDFWGELCIEAGGDLTGFLAKRAPQYFWEWNKLAAAANALVKDVIGRRVEEVRREHGLGPLFAQQVERDLGLALLEHSYAFVKPPVDFARRCFEVYEAGHLPCGWEGVWPAGQLVIF